MKTLKQFKEEYPINDDKITKVDIIEQIYDAIDEAVKFAESWIDVNEELPKKACFLIARKHNGLELGLSFYSDKFWYANIDQTSQVTHWRPINRP